MLPVKLPVYKELILTFGQRRTLVWDSTCRLKDLSSELKLTTKTTSADRPGILPWPLALSGQRGLSILNLLPVRQ